jgi:hypothetical protein
MAVPGGNHIGGGALGRKLARVCAHRAPTSFTSEQLRELPAVRSATLPWLAGYRHERVNDSATEARTQGLVEISPESCGSCGSLRCARRLKLNAHRLQDQMGIRAGSLTGQASPPERWSATEYSAARSVARCTHCPGRSRTDRWR